MPVLLDQYVGFDTEKTCFFNQIIPSEKQNQEGTVFLFSCYPFTDLLKDKKIQTNWIWKRKLKGYSKKNNQLYDTYYPTKNQCFVISQWSNLKRIEINFVQWNCSESEIKTDTMVNDCVKHSLPKRLISNLKWVKLILDKRSKFQIKNNIYLQTGMFFCICF